MHDKILHQCVRDDSHPSLSGKRVMTFEELLRIVGDEPVFETGLLLAGNKDPHALRVQLSRWVRAGKLYRLRRGLYALAPPYQRVRPHPFLVANHLVRPSYVSLQAALAYYNLIPEAVYMVTSVTTARPGERRTPLGVFLYRHVRPALFFGYRLEEVAPGQRAFVALPEKALLDLIYLQPARDLQAYLKELRLQNLERLDLQRLREFAERSGVAKLRRAVDLILALREQEEEAYELL